MMSVDIEQFSAWRGVHLVASCITPPVFNRHSHKIFHNAFAAVRGFEANEFLGTY